MEHYYKNIQGWFDDTRTFDKAVDWFKTGHFVEIGCWKGRSTSYLGTQIINSGHKIKLDCVDTFCGSAEHDNVVQEQLYHEFHKNTLPVRSVIGKVHILSSLAACTKYKDSSLDFVWIDAAHDYDNVTADLNAWYPKVRTGGIIGGDDYAHPNFPDVKRAVDNWYNSVYGMKVYVNTFGQHWHITK